MGEPLPSNLGIDLGRATEAAALVAGRWMGLGERESADEVAAQAMAQALERLEMTGHIVIGEEGKLHRSMPLETGNAVGTGEKGTIDVVVDPIDGSNLLAQGRAGAISVAAAAPAGTLWSPQPAVYMDKIVVDRAVAEALVPECMDAPAAWTLALVARIKGKRVRDLIVFVLDRPRHAHLIDEIRAAGARVMLRTDGDIAGGVLAAMPHTNVDILLGVGGIPEGVLAAVATKALRGAMLGRLAPQSEEERLAIDAAGLDPQQILTCDDMVGTDDAFFAATGITDGPLMTGVSYQGPWAETQSLILRTKTGNRRFLHAEHSVEDDESMSLG